MTSVVVLNGPNLNLLGERDPAVYGTATLADVERDCRESAEKLGLDLTFRQSNSEGELVDWIQEAGREVRAGRCIGAVFNPGAYTHTSIALRDAIEGVQLPLVEVHISNVHAREEFRRHSYVSPAAKGVIAGLGWRGYEAAIRALVAMARESAG